MINASSAPGMLAVNGMSNSDRGSGTANSALLADVLPEDYAAEGVCSKDHPEECGSHPLAGMAFQEKYEHLAFELGGGKPPRQTVGSFLGTDGTAPHTAVKTGSAAMQAAAGEGNCKGLRRSAGTARICAFLFAICPLAYYNKEKYAQRGGQAYEDRGDHRRFRRDRERICLCGGPGAAL